MYVFGDEKFLQKNLVSALSKKRINDLLLLLHVFFALLGVVADQIETLLEGINPLNAASLFEFTGLYLQYIRENRLS